MTIRRFDWATEMVKARLQEKMKITRFESVEPRQAALELVLGLVGENTESTGIGPKSTTDYENQSRSESRKLPTWVKARLWTDNC